MKRSSGTSSPTYRPAGGDIRADTQEHEQEKETELLVFIYHRGVFFVSEGQLVGSKHQRGQSEADPLVSTSSKMFPGRVQNLKQKKETIQTQSERVLFF